MGDLVSCCYSVSQQMVHIMRMLSGKKCDSTLSQRFRVLYLSIFNILMIRAMDIDTLEDERVLKNLVESSQN